MRSLKRITGFVSVFALVVSFGLLGGSVEAALTDNVCKGVNTILEGGSTASTDTECGASEDANNTISRTANDLIDMFSLIIGAAAVVMIIYGGFKYITSGGSDDSTKQAKQTILYALVGLVIVILAQTIVKFIFSKATSISTPTE
jgi:cytochrome bd-type quinol oxidase subunit 2